MKITINGEIQYLFWLADRCRMDLDQKFLQELPLTITYENLISLAGYAPESIVSVTYRTKRSGDLQRSGILSPGGSVELEEDMVFNAYETGNA